MFFVLMFTLAFGTSEYKETYTSDIKLTTTSGKVYEFKRVYENSIYVHNVYPKDFTEHDKKICESLSEVDAIDTTLESDEDTLDYSTN